MREAGYWDAGRQRPQILRWCRERTGYTPQYLYEYVKNSVMPTKPMIDMLAKDLQKPKAWLLLGDEGVEEACAWWAKQPKVPRRRR